MKKQEIISKLQTIILARTKFHEAQQARWKTEEKDREKFASEHGFSNWFQMKQTFCVLEDGEWRPKKGEEHNPRFVDKDGNHTPEKEKAFEKLLRKETWFHRLFQKDTMTITAQDYQNVEGVEVEIIEGKWSDQDGNIYENGISNDFLSLEKIFDAAFNYRVNQEELEREAFAKRHDFDSWFDMSYQYFSSSAEIVFSEEIDIKIEHFHYLEANLAQHFKNNTFFRRPACIDYDPSIEMLDDLLLVKHWHGKIDVLKSLPIAPSNNCSSPKKSSDEPCHPMM